MSSNELHKEITKAILGVGLEELHREMDKPAQDLGYKHRILRHGPVEVALNYLRYGKKGAYATIIHILQDKLSTYQKKKVRELLDEGNKEEAYDIILTNLRDVEIRAVKELMKKL